MPSLRRSAQAFAVSVMKADEDGIVFPTSPARFGKFIADETVKWGKVVNFAGIKAE